MNKIFCDLIVVLELVQFISSAGSGDATAMAAA